MNHKHLRVPYHAVKVLDEDAESANAKVHLDLIGNMRLNMPRFPHLKQYGWLQMRAQQRLRLCPKDMLRPRPVSRAALRLRPVPYKAMSLPMQALKTRHALLAFSRERPALSFSIVRLKFVHEQPAFLLRRARPAFKRTRPTSLMLELASTSSDPN